MDSIRLIASVAVHVVGFGGALFLMIMIFGRPDSVIHTFSKLAHFILKAAMTFIVVGHAAAAVCLCESSWFNILLNVGIVSLWWWAAWFHWYVFLKIRPTKQDGRPVPDEDPPTKFLSTLGMKRPYK